MEKKFRYLVRIANVDLKGDRPIAYGLQRIKGINSTLASAICNHLGIELHKKAGDMPEEETKKIEETILNAEKVFPEYLLNRRKDFDSGEDKHLNGPKLKLQNEFDKKRLQKVKSYKGLRLQAGLPVRGQRTRGNFRKGKALGVQRKKKK